jgi:hypothetical protein
VSERLEEARSVALLLREDGQKVSRRALRRLGIHGSNAELGSLARLIRISQVDPSNEPVPDSGAKTRGQRRQPAAGQQR